MSRRVLVMPIKTLKEQQLILNVKDLSVVYWTIIIAVKENK